MLTSTLQFVASTIQGPPPQNAINQGVCKATHSTCCRVCEEDSSSLKSVFPLQQAVFYLSSLENTKGDAASSKGVSWSFFLLHPSLEPHHLTYQDSLRSSFINLHHSLPFSSSHTMPQGGAPSPLLLLLCNAHKRKL